MKYYKLDAEHRPVSCSAEEYHRLEDFTHGEWRRLGRDVMLATCWGRQYLVRVSTVFVGVWEPFFETMVFPKNNHRDMYCMRYADFQTAAAEHIELCRRIRDCGGLEKLSDFYALEVLTQHDTSVK